MSHRAYRPRPYLPAVLGPRGCVVLLREFGSAIEAMERYGEAMAISKSPDSQRVGQEVVAWVAQTRESARQFGERNDSIAECGNAAMPDDGAAASSLSPPADPLSVGQVAEMTGLGVRQVRNLVGPAGIISATKRGGMWLIDPGSVREYQASRRPVA